MKDSFREEIWKAFKIDWPRMVEQLICMAAGFVVGLLVVGGVIIEHWALVHIDGERYGQHYIEKNGVRYNLVEVKGKGEKRATLNEHQ